MRRVSWRSHGATTSALRHCGFLYLLFYPNPFAFSFSTLKYRFILYGGFGRSPLPVLRRFASIKTTKPSEGGAAWRSRGSINSTLQSAREISLSIFVGQRHPTTVNEQMRTFCFVTFPVPSTLTWSSGRICLKGRRWAVCLVHNGRNTRGMVASGSNFLRSCDRQPHRLQRTARTLREGHVTVRESHTALVRAGGSVFNVCLDGVGRQRVRVDRKCAWCQSRVHRHVRGTRRGSRFLRKRQSVSTHGR